MEVKDIGIKKNRILISFLLITVAVAFILTSVIMWMDYASQDQKEYFKEHAVEVEATVVRYVWSEQHGRTYRAIYEYESEWGTVYRGAYGHFGTESEARKEIGKKITILVDPNSSQHTTVKSENLKGANYERALRNAVVWCFPLPVVLYLLTYRCIYRNVMNKKIRKKVYGKHYNNDRFVLQPQPDTVQIGEVTKVIRWMVCYVKVKYRDQNGALREKWARSWFTHREAKFLRQKKTIRIAPYKNTYGILEEMSVN